MSEERGVSPVVATLVLVGLVLVMAPGIWFLWNEVRLSDHKIANLLVRTNSIGPGDILLFHLSGSPLRDAFEGDRLLERGERGVEEGDLYMNLKWKDLEVRVNGVLCDNSLVEYFLLPDGGRPRRRVLIRENMRSRPAGMENDAVWVENKWVRLTRAVGSQFGRLEYSIDPSLLLRPEGAWVAKFEFWAGGGTGGDATWFYVFCTSTPENEHAAAGGYIIAYDEFEDVILLQYNGVTISTCPQPDIDDNVWHQAMIVQRGTNLKVYFDGDLKIEAVVVHPIHSGQRLHGWGARTGALHNEHRIRNLAVYWEGPHDMEVGDAIVLAFRQARQPRAGDEVEVLYKGQRLRSLKVGEPEKGKPVDACIQMRLIRMLPMENELKEYMKENLWAIARRKAEYMIRFLRGQVEPLIENSRYMENDPYRLGTVQALKDARRLYVVSVAPSFIDMIRIENELRVLTGARDPSFFPSWDNLARASRLVKGDPLHPAADNLLRCLENVENIIAWKPGNRPTRYRVLTRMEDIVDGMKYMADAIPVPFDNVWRDLYFVQIFPQVESIHRESRYTLRVSLRAFNFGTVKIDIPKATSTVWYDDELGENRWWISKHFRRVVGENIWVPPENRLLAKPFMDSKGAAVGVKAWAHQVNDLPVEFRIGTFLKAPQENYSKFPHWENYRFEVPYVRENRTRAFCRAENSQRYDPPAVLHPGDNRLLIYHLTFHRPEDDNVASRTLIFENRIVMMQLDIFGRGGHPDHPYERRMVFQLIGCLVRRVGTTITFP